MDTTYNIIVKKAKKESLTLDGIWKDKNVINLVNDGKSHEIELKVISKGDY